MSIDDLLALIGPAPKVPAAPTPWRTDDARVYDSNNFLLFDFVNAENLSGDECVAVAGLIVEVMNTKALDATTEGVAAPEPEEPAVDHYVDCDGDRWFVFDDELVLSGSRAAAEAKRASRPNSFKALAWVNAKHGPVKPVYAS